MKHLITLLLGASLFFAPSLFNGSLAYAADSQSTELLADHHDLGGTDEHAHDHDHTDEAHGSGHHASPAPWSVIPFVILLLMIATGPLFYAHFWHKYYPAVAATLGTITLIYYLGVLHDTHHPIHSLAEYVSFIALLTALFVASGGILIRVDREGTPMANVVLLFIGAVLANVIGTTGASMLLIRPFIRLNQDRIKPYHVVLFIFIVSNVGGSLTPIGDPPLFLGFLKGIPFFWTVTALFAKWVFGVGLLLTIFYFYDRRNHLDYDPSNNNSYTGEITIKGKASSIWLLVTIVAVFLDPNVLDWVPALIQDHAGHWSIGTMGSLSVADQVGVTAFSFIREIIMFVTAFLAYITASKECLKGNEFDFEPIKEVAFLFIGIFATMMPALQLISEFASGPGSSLINTHSLYWLTGGLSGVLDNAPTYLNFLAAGMGKAGLDISNKADILVYVAEHATDLAAISIAAVFFGAFTYIGNAPNFMVKSIAEQVGINMPSFMGYIVKYSIPFLLPVLLLTWVVFFLML